MIHAVIAAAVSGSKGANTTGGVVRMKISKGHALLAGCMALIISQAALAKDVKVAIVGAMSGPVAQYGDMEFTGAKQAIADINAKGGVNGNKLVGVEYDDACDPKQAVAIANKVINDGIRYVIGHLCSSSTQPASDIYEDEGVLMITPAATAPDLTTRSYKLIMRTTGLDSDQGPTAARYILSAVKPQRIAVVHDKQQYGEGLARSVQDSLKKAGGNVVMFEGITAGDKDFSTLVARLKKENVDFVYFGGYYPEMGQILRQARAAGLKTQFMGPEGVGNSSLSNIAGAASEGMLVTLPKRYDQVPANQAIVDALKAKKQNPTGPFVWTTYAALQSLTAGMERSKSEEPADIVKNLKEGATVPTVMGDLSWNEKGDLKGFEFGVFKWHADGSSDAVK
ncbi:branched-chain amino acid ABC transport system,periplasmic component [Erwinia pyrifoliae DSM 12163]|nr:branched-chain amino acid ABC transport system,periplasmic component [Erwinia pyrifoliae DSM 12163]